MKPENFSSVGARLEYVRGNYGIGEFALILGVHRNTYKNYEKNSRLPDAETLLALFSNGINPTWILTGHGEVKIEVNASDLESEQISTDTEEKHLQSVSYENSEVTDKSRKSLPSSDDEVGIRTPLTAGELTNLGHKWWMAVQELSDPDQQAILTLVFNHVISKFIQLHNEKFEDQEQQGAERLSSYLNNNGRFTVDKSNS